MIDKVKFLTELSVTIYLARLEQHDVINPLDMRLFIGNDVNSDIYAINKEEIDAFYEKIKNEEREWFVDFYENYNEENCAEYIGVSLFKHEVDGSKVEEDVEEEPTPKTYRFLTTNVEYGYIDVVATSMEEAQEKAYSFDGDYFVHSNELTDVQFGEFVENK